MTIIRTTFEDDPLTIELSVEHPSVEIAQEVVRRVFPALSTPPPANHYVVVQAKEYEDPPRCSAHGERHCELCGLNGDKCLDGEGGCGYYRAYGMHWDTCMYRIRSKQDALDYFKGLVGDTDG